ncbi:MAG: type III secretion system outer membrane ring subunit SctC [Parvibaculaceae bacterium]|nr:type III secretion system outer membrane ring subunit SctC [Parvibaculaceae bacterium]
MHSFRPSAAHIGRSYGNHQIPSVFAVFIIFFILIYASCATQRLAAAEMPWPDASYAYRSSGEDIQTTLKNFANNFGIRVSISSRIHGQVEGRFLSATPTEFLERLATTYALNWFTYGGTLYVNSKTDTIQRIIKVGQADSLRLKTALLGLGILQEKFGWGELPDRGVVIISGPPAYVDLVIKTVSGLPIDRPADFEMQVFKLKYAFADDRTYNYRDLQVRVPGIATILQNLITGNGPIGTQIVPLPSHTRQVTDINLDDKNGRQNSTQGAGPNVLPNPVFQNDSLVNAAPFNNPEHNSIATIQADVRLNAIIIKDRPENIRIYQNLIAELDVPASLIEIEATIIDVNTGDLQRLGIGWPGEARVSFSGGPRLTTLVEGAQATFFVKLQALAQENRAEILSRPSILTIDNLQALIDLSQTINIKVQGERVAQLVEISTGTMLRITPHLIKRRGTPNDIQLSVDITDGVFTPNVEKGEVPIIDENKVNTQAIVSDHQSLLIAGYTKSENSQVESGVPLLKDIPMLGGLFKSVEERTSKRQRIYLITPTVVRL